MKQQERGEILRRARQIRTDHGVQIAAEYMAGNRLHHLKEQWGLSPATIAKIVRANGGEIRPTGNAGKGDRMVRAKQLMGEHGVKIANDYANGMHMQQLADQWNVSIDTIASTVRRHGGQVRKRGLGSGNYTMERHPAFKSGRTTRQDGYVHVLLPLNSPWLPMANRRTRYVFEHRLVMAQKLGRLLAGNETVHHIDGNRSNNDPSNLQLRQGKHGKGVHFACGDCGSRNIVAVHL